MGCTAPQKHLYKELETKWLILMIPSIHIREGTFDACSDSTHTLNAADGHFLETVQVIFGETVTANGSYDAGIVLVHNDDDEGIRRGVLTWRIDSENPGSNLSDHYYTESDEESVTDTEDEESGYYPDYDKRFSCDPAVADGGALAHTICLRLYMALGAKLRSKTGESPPTDAPLMDSELRACVPYYDKWETGAKDEVQVKTLDLKSARGCVSGIIYGTEGQREHDSIFVPEKVWMLTRPDRFPPVPVQDRKKAERTVLRHQSMLERLPVETLTLLLETILSGPDDPLTKGKTLRALAGTSPLLRHHIRSSNLWIRLCARSEFLSDDDRTDSAKAVSRARKTQPKNDWMAYFFKAAQSLSLRNRRRILRICEEIWNRLGYYRTADMPK
ncbi:hypothetical protein DFS34DRAFT_646356 [Phlyctochytrium arcticum]|nr:hypothetical protein DFS34DRAFT_646356 [Phlyctochytrium arcticum]